MRAIHARDLGAHEWLVTPAWAGSVDAFTPPGQHCRRRFTPVIQRAQGILYSPFPLAGGRLGWG